MELKIENVVALVTGANRGIGKAITLALAKGGAKRVYAASREAGSGTPVAPNIEHVLLDVTNDAQINAVAKLCPDVNVLVNNAGVALGKPLIGADSLDAAHRELDVNYFGSLRMARAFAPTLKQNGGGAIVNVLSILGRVSAPSAGSYCASKAAAFSMTQGIRGELASQGTLVIGVMPAFVDTDMVRSVQMPKATPEEVALSILAALRDGTEDVYPGEMAAQVAQGLLGDPKAVERQLARM